MGFRSHLMWVENTKMDFGWLLKVNNEYDVHIPKIDKGYLLWTTEKEW